MAQHAEPDVVYDLDEIQTAEQHAAEALDLAKRADAMAGARGVPHWTIDQIERTERRAQWHATMAVYEALVEAAEVAEARA